MSRKYCSPGIYRSFLLTLTLAFAGVLSAQVDSNLAAAQGDAAYKAKEYETAIKHYTAVVKAEPEGAIQNVLYSLGFSYFFESQYEEAVDIFQKYLKKYPNSDYTTEVHFTLGRSLLQLEGKEDEAISHFAKAAEKPEYLEEARFMTADAYIKKGDTAKAAETLQGAIKANSAGPGVLRASLQLIDLYVSAEELDKAIDMLEILEKSTGYPDVIVTVNHRFVQIGDMRLEAKDYSSALAAYSSVRPRAQVLAIQTKRLAAMRRLKADYDKRIAADLKNKRKLPRGMEDNAALLAAMIENTDNTLKEVTALEDYDATIQYRVGRCYFNMERYWPASVAFEAVASGNPQSLDASTALFGAIMSQYRLQRSAATRDLCNAYLKIYSKEKHVDQVAELNAILLLQDGLTDKVEGFLDPYLNDTPDTPIRENLLTLLANARFQGGKYEAAAKDYDTLRKDFATSPNLEEFIYRRALCDFLRNDYEATIKAFDAYDRDYPKGDFQADIQYRRGIIQLAKKEYDALIASMTALLKNPNAEGYGGQVHTLLGDAWSAKGDNTNAATEYASALKSANGDENVIQYSLEQATTMLRGARRWEELESLWQDFLKNNPKHAMELRGVSELSKLLVRANKKDEAREMLATYALREIHNPRSEYVETLLSQLAGLYVPPRTVKKDVAPPDTDELLADLSKQLDVTENERTLTYLARVNFAKAELARMMRDLPRNGRFLNAIAISSKPEDLSPIMLSIIGQYLLDNKQQDKAVPLFTRLRDGFPDSPYSDAAPVGLGRIALVEKDYETALKEFDYAITRSKGGSMLKEATFGKALALYWMKKFDDSRKLFEEVVASKEWRGAEKAGSLYYLGEIAAEKGDEGAALAYFQRVYLSHGAFMEYSAKSYIRSADMLEKSGQHDAALDTYRLLLRNPKYAETPEATIARQKVEE
ncbi:MAG: tetratricopeptide repeat protein [Armatimonadetes bacterium]|nr:tetratricopeptide repeat protein [Akkermansiaceae bacterium]